MQGMPLVSIACGNTDLACWQACLLVAGAMLRDTGVAEAFCDTVVQWLRQRCGFPAGLWLRLPATYQPRVDSTAAPGSVWPCVCACAGVQSAVVTLSGASVALVAQGHQLALVWHAADPDSAGCQHLHFSVYNVVEQQKVTLSDCRGVQCLPTLLLLWVPSLPN